MSKRRVLTSDEELWVTILVMGLIAYGAWSIAGAVTSTTLVRGIISAIIAIVIGFTAAVAWGVVSEKATRSKDRDRQAYARGGQIEEHFGLDRARRSAASSRPGMSERIRSHAGWQEVGLYLGKAGKQDIGVGFEDHVVVYAPTGAGKSARLMSRAALSAPGPLVVTANEAGLLDTIYETRANKGRVWVFDPLDLAHWPEPCSWDAVSGCQDAMLATERGTAFVEGLSAGGTDSTNAGFFQRNSIIAMTRLLHAAALGGHTMTQVLRWGIDLENGARQAADVIRSSDNPLAEPDWAGALEGVAEGAEETVSSTRQTLQQSLEPLTLRAVAQWLIPDGTRPVFDSSRFVRSQGDTLVLISDSTSSTNIGPLCTMLLQEVFTEVKKYAAVADGRRLDPPMRMVLDEVANIAPIKKLPTYAAEVRKNGVQLILAFQSDVQAKTRWGDKEGQQLLEQMSAEILLPGVKSLTTLERFSKLIGKVEVTKETISNSGGSSVANISSTDQLEEAVREHEARVLGKHQAAMIYADAPPVKFLMPAWFEEEGAARISAGAARTLKWRQERDQVFEGEFVK